MVGTTGQALLDEAAATGYTLAWRAVRHLPEPRARALFTRAADHVHDRRGRGVERLRANLRLACPGLDEAEIDRLTHEGVRSYFRYWCESFRLPAWPLDDLVARTTVVGEHRLRDAYEAGGGVISALPHMGNWDWAGAWACGTGMPLMTVAERLRPERLYDEFVAYRRSLGMRILPLTGGQPPLPALAEQLRAGGFVCLLADRDLGRAAVPVLLCGQPARMPPGPALLAQQTGAPLLPTTCSYDGERMVLTLHEAVPVPAGPDGVAAATQGVADAFTRAIRAAPQDWHMMQRVFVDEPVEAGGR